MFVYRALADLIDSSPNLESLELSSILSNIHIVNRIPPIKHLALHHSFFYDADHMSRMWNAPKLETLRITDLWNVIDRLRELFSQSTPNLKSLEIEV